MAITKTLYTTIFQILALLYAEIQSQQMLSVLSSDECFKQK